MSDRSIGLLELSSVASGFTAVDAMLKTAQVDVLLARTICSGKYLAIIGGDVASVQAAVEAGSQVERLAVIDMHVIPRVHDKVFPAISGAVVPHMRGAFGCIETFSVVTGIHAADAACKAADVDLLELRAAMALGGKAFVTLTGDVGAVTAAVEAGKQVASDEGLLVNAVVIPGPHPSLLAEII
jgi:microcompartment protein CcmL/EutN